MVEFVLKNTGTGMAKMVGAGVTICHKLEPVPHKNRLAPQNCFNQWNKPKFHITVIGSSGMKFLWELQHFI
jgi:hypothetical protein